MLMRNKPAAKYASRNKIEIHIVKYAYGEIKWKYTL